MNDIIFRLVFDGFVFILFTVYAVQMIKSKTLPINQQKALEEQFTKESIDKYIQINIIGYVIIAIVFLAAVIIELLNLFNVIPDLRTVRLILYGIGLVIVIVVFVTRFTVCKKKN